MPTEKTQLEMFQEDLDNAILGQALPVKEESQADIENADNTVEETEEVEA